MNKNVLRRELPLLLLVPRRFLPDQMCNAYRIDVDDATIRRANVSHWIFWLVVHAVLVSLIAAGLGWEALMLWYLPARVSAMVLAFVFAWLPHHPAVSTGRYDSTRVAAFPGSRWIARGHDYHAIHHLFPRVPHTRLRDAWIAMGEDLVAKGVRAEGTAPYATEPIRW